LLRELERHVVAVRIPAEALAPVFAGEGPGWFPLADVPAEYSDWELVSHTFNVLEDRTAVLTIIFERRAQRGR
jgi:hypothetical protein